MARRPPLLQGFAPVIDARITTLILGSFPSEVSLAAGQYYAHPRNQFWPILGRVLAEPLAVLPYEERLARLLSHRIGLWDVLGACRREGSLDAAIESARANDFEPLLHQAPRLARVLFNGQAAGRFAPRFAQHGFEVAVLPSTSPAHAGRSVDQKAVLWQRALQAPLAAPPHRRNEPAN